MTELLNTCIFDSNEHTHIVMIYDSYDSTYEPFFFASENGAINFLNEKLNTVDTEDKGMCCIAKITNKIKIETSVNIIRNAN